MAVNSPFFTKREPQTFSTRTTTTPGGLSATSSTLQSTPAASSSSDAVGARPVDTSSHERDMMVVVLTGHTGGALAGRVRETDVLICVPHERPARVREVHDLVLNCLCDGVDTQLLGEQES